MLRYIAGIVLLGFIVSIGGHLPVLQAAASINMMREHCAHDSWLDALKETIEETISGEHQCAICRFVRSSLLSPSSRLSSVGLKRLPRFDSFPPGASTVFVPDSIQFPPEKTTYLECRPKSSPPAPPPRAA